jgi:hypothetical protein
MKVKVNFKQYFLYLVRWQLSTPVLALVLNWLSNVSVMRATIIANFIGGLIFFWVDKFIFTSRLTVPQWQVQENVVCHDCGKICRGYRLVKSVNYDKSKSAPQFRCENCSQLKACELKACGVTV